MRERTEVFLALITENKKETTVDFAPLPKRILANSETGFHEQSTRSRLNATGDFRKHGDGGGGAAAGPNIRVTFGRSIDVNLDRPFNLRLLPY